MASTGEEAAPVAVDDVLAKLKHSKKADYLRVATDKRLLRLFEKSQQSRIDLESVEFSDSVLKINKRGKEQERALIITNVAVYNFLPGRYSKAQRSIPIEHLRGVALSRSSDEFLFQVRNEYDYRFRIVRRAEVIQIVSKHFKRITKKELKCTFSDDLDALQVTKEDMRKKKREEEHVEHKEPVSPQGIVGMGRKATVVSMIGESDDAPTERMAGWLSKKGHTNDAWRRRFFRLGENAMRYYEARTKGTVMVTSGRARPWRNHRYDVVVRESQEPSTPDHLLNIFEDAERREAFLAYCASVYSEENARFYCECARFAKIEDETERVRVAQHIFNEHVRNGAPHEISSPPNSRTNVEKIVEKGVAAPTDMFVALQRVVLSIMRVEILPGYLEYAKKQLDTHDHTIKQALTASDKQVESCTGCALKFSLIRRRSFCHYCNKVFCSSCVSKETEMPEEFGVQQMFPVCDMCFGIINPHTKHTHFAFTYASPNRNKPLNLTAESDAELTTWVAAIEAAIELYGRRGAATGAPLADEAPECKERINVEGWLWKEDPTTKGWRRRYFVLNGPRLWYYELSSRGFIPLSDGLSVAPNAEDESPTLTMADATFGGFTSESGFRYRLNVSSNERVFQLAADTPELQREWITALQERIKAASTNPSAGDQKTADEEMMDDAAVFAQAFNEEAPQGEVTFVFTDIQNSTKLWESNPDGMNVSLEMHDATLRRLLKKFRGYEVKTEGDAFMVTFFTALDAILWCIAVQKELLQCEWPESLLTLDAAAPVSDAADGSHFLFKGIRIRMGIHTGNPSCRRNPVTGRMDYFGPVVNRAARVSDSAHGGQIICTSIVHDRLKAGQEDGSFVENVVVENLGSFPYKGISTMVDIYQISPLDLVNRAPFPPLRVHRAKAPSSEKPQSEEM